MMRQLLFLVVFALLCPSYLLTPVPKDEKSDQQIDDVKDLESLHTEKNKGNINAEAVHHESEASHHNEIEPMPTPLPSAENPQPNSRSAIFRHRGITQAKKSGYWSEKSQQPNEGGSSKYAGIQYSPSDLAAYVFNTGDEEGVAVAVEELVREGLMGRTDAINYLQDVKQILTYLRDQYEQEKKLEEYRNRMYAKSLLAQRLPSLPREQFLAEMDAEKRQPKALDTPPAPAATTEHPQQAVIASTSEVKAPTHSASTTILPNTDASAAKSAKESSAKVDNDKNEDIKRRVPPKTSNSFTLEFIYKLAKDMFTQSILRDDPTAEDTLSGLVAFLESEVGNKRISPEMKEKVLEVVSAALVDSLREYLGYISENQGPMYDESGLYQHVPESPGSSKAFMSEVYRKLSNQGHDNMLQLAPKNNKPNSS